MDPVELAGRTVKEVHHGYYSWTIEFTDGTMLTLTAGGTHNSYAIEHTIELGHLATGLPED